MANRDGGKAGWLPSAATALAIASCYGTAAAVTLLSLLGISIAIDARASAAVITLFAALAAVAIAVAYRRHRKIGPVALAGLGLALILWVMYGSYSRVLELVGFVLMAAATAWDWRAHATRQGAGTDGSWVEAEDLAARLQQEPKPIVVDVREPDEFAGELGHLRGARNLPLGALMQRIAELAPFKERQMVLNCRTQMRSAKGASILKDAGFANVAVLRGGMAEWARRRFPIEGGTRISPTQEKGQ
jgi:rhodanese-related sulfurtransferase